MKPPRHALAIKRLRDRLAHYRTCSDPRCKARLAAFDALAAEFRKPGVVRAEPKPEPS